MLTAKEINEQFEKTFTDGIKDFRACAFFDEQLDCIRVLGRDCSVTETRINGLITVLEANHPAQGRRQCVGFTIKGARHFCATQGLNLKTPIKISDLLNAILSAMPNVVVQTFIDHLARPLVAAEKIEQVEASGALPSEA